MEEKKKQLEIKKQTVQKLSELQLSNVLGGERITIRVGGRPTTRP
jgi:hypothetical protein